MIHARPDYNRIQDPENKIPADEPVFLLRAKDKCMLPTLRKYHELVKEAGADDEMLDSIMLHIVRIEEYQEKHGTKVPDIPTA